MPNANTVERLVGAASPAQGTLVIPSISPSGTSAFIPTNQSGSAATLSVGNAAMLAAPATGGINFDGLAFKLRLVGKATTTQSCNITAAIQLGSSTTVTSGNTIATTGAKALNTASGNFMLEATVVWDSTSTKISGFQTGVGADQSLISLAALTNNVTTGSLATLQFVPVLTASATAGTVISINEFTAEVV